jgi:hypothetical protein
VIDTYDLIIETNNLNKERLNYEEESRSILN